MAVPSTPPPFSERARSIVLAAYHDAAGRGHYDVGTRHLVLALLHDEGCAGHRTLTALGLTYEAADDWVGFFSMEFCPSSPSIDNGTEQALVHALREAAGRGHDHTGTGHLLHGLLHDTHGSGPYLLERLLGVGPAQVTEHLEFAEPPAARPYPGPGAEVPRVDDLLTRSVSRVQGE